MARPRLVLATGLDELDAYFMHSSEFEVVKQIHYKEALYDIEEEADVVVFSLMLPGKNKFEDIADIMFRLRLSGFRVVFVAGGIDKNHSFLPEVIAQGVYDILIGQKIGIQDIVARIKEPATFRQAIQLLATPSRPPSQRLSNLINKFSSLIGRGLSESVAQTIFETSEERIAKKEQTTKAISEAYRGSKEVTDKPFERKRFKLSVNKPVVCVWSPASSGATFMAVELARKISEHKRVFLSDLDGRSSVHKRLLLRDKVSHLDKAINGELTNPFVVNNNFGVYTSSKRFDERELDEKVLSQIFEGPARSSEVIICDLPRTLTPELQELVAQSTMLIVIVDSDVSRLEHTKTALSLLGKVQEKVVFVANNFRIPEGFDSHWHPSSVLGFEKDKHTWFDVGSSPESVLGSFASATEVKDKNLEHTFSNIASWMLSKLFKNGRGKEESSSEEAPESKEGIEYLKESI